MFAKLKKFVQEKKASIKKLAIPTTIMAAIAAATPMAMAADPDPTKIIKELLNVIFKIAGYIGILLLAWGAVTLVLAIRNEDADSKSRAVMLIVVAIALMCLGTLFGAVMKAAGYTL